MEMPPLWAMCVSGFPSMLQRPNMTSHLNQYGSIFQPVPRGGTPSPRVTPLVPQILLGQCPHTYKVFCFLIASDSFLLFFIFLEALSAGQQRDLPPRCWSSHILLSGERCCPSLCLPALHRHFPGMQVALFCRQFAPVVFHLSLLMGPLYGDIQLLVLSCP